MLEISNNYSRTLRIQKCNRVTVKYVPSLAQLAIILLPEAQSLPAHYDCFANYHQCYSYS